MQKKIKYILLWSFFFGLITSIGISLVALPSFRTHQNFQASTLNLENYDLFDLGVADINFDGWLDIFTINHSALQSFLLNQEKGQFTNNTITHLGLDQDVEFPGLEDSLKKPEFKEPGLYIYRYNRNLYLDAYQLQSSILGQLELPWSIQINSQERAKVYLDTIPVSEGKIQAIARFEISPNGKISLTGQDDIIELPHTITIDSLVNSKQIFIGLHSVNPENNSFNLMWRDRHSLAWTDLNQDQKMDVFITRGGVKGELDQIPISITDEMMLMGDNKFTNVIDRLGMDKKSCPGRKAAWVDFNQDNLLDLYIICGRNNKPIHPNLLYQQQQNGEFIDVANKLKLDFPEEGTFQWLDFDNDGDMDLLITREELIELHIQEEGQFTGQLISDDFSAKILNLLVSDFDADGDFDIYAESKYIDKPNLLLINNNKIYQPVNPKTFGLPEMGVGGSWVDFNNDGLTDFYSVPNGLYQQNPDHHFQETRLLNKRWQSAKPIDARTVWADIDNDGDRDLISVANQTPPIYIRLLNRVLKLNLDSNWQKLWVSKIYRNNSNNNNWLQLNLSASGNNPQAIGAKVIVKTTRNQQFQFVGNSESSYFSQGHYRLYFGLGKDTVAKSVQVIWPDGQTQQFYNLSANAIWQLEQNSKPIPLQSTKLNLTEFRTSS